MAPLYLLPMSHVSQQHWPAEQDSRSHEVQHVLLCVCCRRQDAVGKPSKAPGVQTNIHAATLYPYHHYGGHPQGELTSK